MKKVSLCSVVFLFITVCWMVMIFYMSSRTAVESSGMSEGIGAWVAGILNPDYDLLPDAERLLYLDQVHTVIRKLAHFSEYLILGCLIYADFRLWGSVLKQRSAGKLVLLSWVLGTLYSVTDEFHQMFVPGRSGELLDVAIDSCGVLLGTGLIYALFLIINKRKNNDNNN